MHEDVTNKPITLSLNSNWQALGFITIKQAIVAMTGGLGSTPPALGLAIEVSEDGELTSAVPTTWDDWVKLPVRASDLSILTKSGPIRAPLVVVRPTFGKMPQIVPKLSKRAILERDGFRCQYTNEVLPASQLNVDHVIPRDRGGKDEWGNLVASRKDVNSKKGNKLNHEAGLKLIKQPKAPGRIPKSATVKQARHSHQKPFIK